MIHPVRSARLIVGLVVGTLVMIGCSPAGTGGTGTPVGSPAGGTGANAALQAVCDAGKREGSFTYWSQYTPENMAKLEQAFAAAHPGIKIDYLQIPNADGVQRVVTETAAGRQIQVDVVKNTHRNALDLLDRNLIARDIDWVGLGVPADYVAYQNGSVRLNRTSFGIAYNTNLVKPADLPKKWEDLLDPKWRGKMVVINTAAPFPILAKSWGLEKTLDFARRLRQAVNPQLVAGTTGALVKVVSGEAAIVPNRDSEVGEQKALGAPIELAYLDEVPVGDDFEWVLKAAPHPNAARCYVGWRAAQGQEIYNKIESKTNAGIPPGVPASAKIVAVSTPQEEQQSREAADALVKVLQGQ